MALSLKAVPEEEQEAWWAQNQEADQATEALESEERAAPPEQPS
jgi:hypothetical protein